MTDKDALRALATYNRGSDEYLAAFAYIRDELSALRAGLMDASADALLNYWESKYNGTWPTSEAEKT